MFKINTKDGEKYLVALTGPRSYTIGGQRISRGGTLPVTRRTRDYLVATGAWADFDPNPPAAPAPVYSPRFGERPAQFDADDFQGGPLTADDLDLIRSTDGDTTSDQASGAPEEKKQETGESAPAKAQPSRSPRAASGVKVSGKASGATGEDDAVTVS